jgi:hypothetical protein
MPQAVRDEVSLLDRELVVVESSQEARRIFLRGAFPFPTVASGVRHDLSGRVVLDGANPLV